MIILAFDPGETTGWCRVDTAMHTVTGGSFPLWEGIGLYYAAGGYWKTIDAIVVERFLLYPWAAKRLRWDKLKPVEVIGVIKFMAQKRSIPVTMQNAADAKRIKLAKKPEGFDRHALDAFRHALAFLKREGLLADWLQEYIT
jgi:hypothetical protein